MKIVITSFDANIDAQFSPRFGRCANFIVIDTESREWEAFPNPAASAGGGAGPQAVQSIAKQDVEAVVSGRYGPNAYTALKAAGIKTFVASGGTVSEVLDQYLAGKLEQVSTATGPGLHGGGRR